MLAAWIENGGEMTGGVTTALDQVVADLPDGGDLVQAALFEPEEVGALDAPSPLSAAIEPRKRKSGRPVGSRNRRTEAVAGWLLSQGRHPVLVMMEAYAMAPAELAAKIGLRPTVDAEEKGGPKVWSNDVLLEVYKLQLRMAEAAAPYVAQKLPQALTVDGAAALHVSFAGVSLAARGGALQGGEVIEGQAMSVRLPVKSDASSRTDGQATE